MEIHRDHKAGKLYLSQKKYLKKVFEGFNMGNLSVDSLVAHFKLLPESWRTSEEEMKKMSQVPYSSVVGKLMHAMVHTRPDLSYAISVVSHYMHNPDKDHWAVV